MNKMAVGLKVKSSIKAGACEDLKAASDQARLDFQAGKITRAEQTEALRAYQRCINGI